MDILNRIERVGYALSIVVMLLVSCFWAAHYYLEEKTIYPLKISKIGLSDDFVSFIEKRYGLDINRGITDPETIYKIVTGHSRTSSYDGSEDPVLGFTKLNLGPVYRYKYPETWLVFLVWLGWAVGSFLVTFLSITITVRTIRRLALIIWSPFGWVIERFRR